MNPCPDVLNGIGISGAYLPVSGQQPSIPSARTVQGSFLVACIIDKGGACVARWEGVRSKLAFSLFVRRVCRSIDEQSAGIVQRN